MVDYNTVSLSYLTGSCECNSIGLGVPPGPVKVNRNRDSCYTQSTCTVLHYIVVVNALVIVVVAAVVVIVVVGVKLTEKLIINEMKP